jgi:hypothetical protein
MSDENMQTVGPHRSNPVTKKKGGSKSRRRRPTAARSNLFIPPEIDWPDIFKSSIVQQPLQPPVPERTLGDLIVDGLKTSYNQSWKEADPESYFVFQATWEVAPNWPHEWDWLLTLTALAALARGASRIADRGKTN